MPGYLQVLLQFSLRSSGKAFSVTVSLFRALPFLYATLEVARACSSNRPSWCIAIYFYRFCSFPLIFIRLICFQADLVLLESQVNHLIILLAMN